jgi:hypothetical protein
VRPRIRIVEILWGGIIFSAHSLIFFLCVEIRVISRDVYFSPLNKGLEDPADVSLPQKLWLLCRRSTYRFGGSFARG